MKFKSLNMKLNIAILGIALFSLLIASLILFNYQKKIELNVYLSTKKELIQTSKEKIESKMRVGITNAISIANDDRVKNSFIKDSRDCAIKSFTEISQKMKKYTAFKNIKIHLHTKDNISFVRNHPNPIKSH